MIMRNTIKRGLPLLILLTVLLGACTNPFFVALLGEKEKSGKGEGFVPVTGITGVPTYEKVGVDLTLSGTVEPAIVANKDIVWSVKNVGTTGASISGSTLSTTGEGTVEVTAKIANGLAAGTDYTEDFSITIGAFTTPARYRETALTTPNDSDPVTIAGNSAYSHTTSMGVWRGMFSEGRTVILSPFKIAKHETTYELWYEVKQWAAGNGYTFANAGREGNDGTDGAAPTAAAKREPVTGINWRDVIVWCNAYSEMSGKTPVYKRSGGVIKDSTNTTACDWAEMDTAANGYRLPTEAEWEYAARGGGTPDPSGTFADTWAETNDETTLDIYAWYKDNADGATHPAGEKMANRLG
jgi:hypothetical protein